MFLTGSFLAIPHYLMTPVSHLYVVTCYRHLHSLLSLLYAVIDNITESVMTIVGIWLLSLIGDDIDTMYALI